MKYVYGEFDGHPFPSPDSLFPPDKVVQLILQYGQKALDAMDKLKGDDERDYVEALIEAGLLERDEETGALRLTPKMLRGIEHKALLEIFEGVNRGAKEGHSTQERGRSDERTDGTKAYEFGDPLSEIDLGATMRNALRRWESHRGDGSPTLPIPINGSDFELHLTEGQADVATCVLLDMSGSMMRYGRFYQAKRVALGMASLIRKKFPQDTIDFVGFYSLATRILERDLPLVMPKPISVYDSDVRVRVPLAQAQADPKLIPQHFTNLQLGLRMARQILSRRGAQNKQVFIITDGQPTAHAEPAAGPMGEEMLYLIYPPAERTSQATLQEALRCQQQGIRIATFALIEDYWGMDWVGFVDQLSRLTRGTAFYCASENLSSTVIQSYISGKKKKAFLH
ncbi:MAG: VWA domain-containing protein [Planctomycetota bacterium]|nr:VWA domain-containing protein [Planctomycetota bacterium]